MKKKFSTYDELVNDVKAMEPVELNDIDYFDSVPDPAFEVIDKIIQRLPNVWKDDLDWMEVEIATNGDELLFKHEVDCEKFADLLDNHVFGTTECHTGYYDPYEDAKSGETDANSGWYYIDWD